MSSLANRQDLAQQERRKTGRMLIDIPVRLRTVSSTRECRMANISDAGAQLEIEEPPAPGVSGWLILGEDEIYCKVIWSNLNTCGIEFENELGPSALDAMIGSKRRETGPIANTGKIAMGRKRAALLPDRGD